jgi:peptide/nickel transport system substrate-binding protein
MTPRKLLLFIAVGLILLVFCGTILAQSGSDWKPYGPRADEIVMVIIRDSEAQRIAFQRGDIHVVPGIFGLNVDEFKTIKNSRLETSVDNRPTHLMLNMRRKPLDMDPVRQAIAYIVDREAIAVDILEGHGLPLSSTVLPYSPYYNSNVTHYSYNLAKAGEILDKAGYTIDRQTKTRIDPNTGKTTKEITILTPLPEAAGWARIGKMIADAAKKIGLPIKHQAIDFGDMLDRIDALDFDMYVSSWSLDRQPRYLKNLFHSDGAAVHGSNQAGICIPELDQILEVLESALDFATARQAAMETQAILAEKQPCIMLYVPVRYDAFRSDKVTGYVSALRYPAAGYDNKWTQLNIRDIKGNAGTVRWMLHEVPKTLNPCSAGSVYDRKPLMWISDKLIETHPETLEDMPWLAKEWSMDTWESGRGEVGAVITLYLEENVKWHDGMPFTAEDIKFTIDYVKEASIPWHVNLMYDADKVEVIDEHTIKIYFTSVSYWKLYDINDLPILPKHIWQDVKDYENFEPWKEAHPKVKGLTKLIGTGPFIFKEYKPGQQITLVKNKNYWKSSGKK